MEFTRSAGREHSVAIKNDGSLKSWGRDQHKQRRDTPEGNNFVFVSAGGGHSVALRSNGSLESWGDDNDKQVRDTHQETILCSSLQAENIL